MQNMRKLILVPEEKYKRLQDKLKDEKYNKTSHSALNPLSNVTTGVSAEKVDVDKETKINQEQILSTIPPRLRNQANAVLQYVLSAPKQILDWSKRGEMIFRGQLFPTTNISDFIGDVVRQRKSFKPLGVSYFYKALADLNIPEGIISNEYGRNQVKAYKQGMTDVTVSPPGIPAIEIHKAKQGTKHKINVVNGLPFKWKVFKHR